LWLGAAASIDFLVAENFSTVDSFLADPGGRAASARIGDLGRDSVRFLLRRNAGEENARIFEVWEWAQLGLGAIFFTLLVAGERPPASTLVMVPLMLLIVVAQRFFLTPQVIALGRQMDDLPATALANNPIVTQFWTFHGVYSGLEILKLLLGIGVGARLVIRRSDQGSSKQNG
jgi:hypothetical protein